MGRIGRGFSLMKQAYGVLRQDKELLVLPLLSGLAIAVVIASFVLGLGLHEEGAADRSYDAAHGLLAFAMYVVLYAVAFFFQAALIAGAMERMRGGDPTVGSAIRAASARLVPILGWSVVAATVGLLLRAIQERSELLGKIVVGLIGAGWSLATFFVVPVLVMERAGVGGSLGRSVSLFKRTWGETMTGHVGFGVASLILLLPVVLVAGLLASFNPVLGGIAGVFGGAVVLIFLNALQGVFTAALYRYAAEDAVPPGFDENQVRSAFGALHGRRS